MIDFLSKELVRSFDYSDACEDRSGYTKVLINGRTYYKHGTMTATTVVGDLYKVHCPGEEQFNYILLIGVARQHPCDVKINKETGIEIAAVNAKVNPVAHIKLSKKIDWYQFKMLAQFYIETLPGEFVKTAEEIQMAGKQVNKYIR